MRKLYLTTLIVLAGCATSDEYRVNAFSPKKGPACPGDQYAVCDMHMGKAILCECVIPREHDWEPDYETE